MHTTHEQSRYNNVCTLTTHARLKICILIVIWGGWNYTTKTRCSEREVWSPRYVDGSTKLTCSTVRCTNLFRQSGCQPSVVPFPLPFLVCHKLLGISLHQGGYNVPLHWRLFRHKRQVALLVAFGGWCMGRRGGGWRRGAEGEEGDGLTGTT